MRNKDRIWDELLYIFPGKIRRLLLQAGRELEERKLDVQEIRLRAGRPLLIRAGSREFGFGADERLTEEMEKGYLVSAEEVAETVEYLVRYSMYAYQEELRQGFLTIAGGHRVGVAGKVVLEEGKISCIRPIACLNLRVAHQVRGCGDAVLPYLTEEGDFCHTLLVSPPGCGKTTLLRDLIRQISNGTSYFKGQTVGLVDERSEIGGSYQGIPQLDLGIRTDVLDGCPKGEGIWLLLRSMAPKVLAVDEIGGEKDIHALQMAASSGCKLLATAHGADMEDLKRKPLLSNLVEKEIFKRYVFLDGEGGPGHVRGIESFQDGREKKIC